MSIQICRDLATVGRALAFGLFGAILALADPASAGTLRAPQGAGERYCDVVFEGPIETGDSADIDARLPFAHEGDFTLCLDSPGGFLEEGIRLSDAIENKGVATVVLGGDTCMSACAIAFLGGACVGIGDYGEERFYDFPCRYAFMGSVIGFHAPFLQLVEGAEARTFTVEDIRETWTISRTAARLYAQALSDRNVPMDLIVEFLAVEDQEFFLLDTLDRARRVGIVVHDLPEGVPDETVYLETCADVFGLDRPSHNDLSGDGEGWPGIRFVTDENAAETTVQAVRLINVVDTHLSWRVCRIRYDRYGSIAVESCYLVTPRVGDSFDVPVSDLRLLGDAQPDGVGGVDLEPGCKSVAYYWGRQADMRRSPGDTLIYDRTRQ